MKKILYIFSISISVIFIFQLSSCIKAPDPFNPGDADNVYNGCRIKQIVTAGQYASFTRIFTYNSDNDPLSETGTLGLVHGGTGNPDLTFKYDNRHRLIEFAGLYANGYYEYLHHYTYQGNRILIDTVSIFGLYGGPLPPPGQVAYGYLRYDKLNRVVQDSFFTPGPNSSLVINYVYDANGNLVTDNAYDNKLNPRRTNKIWMFIDRNYSVNNPVAASAYNSSGLPLHLNLFGVFLFSGYGGSTDITYECK